MLNVIIMRMYINLDISALDNPNSGINKVKWLPQKVEKEITNDMFNSAGRWITKVAKIQAPRKTGKLKEGINYRIEEKKLIIELDGSQHYEKDNKEYDDLRTQFFNSLDINAPAQLSSSFKHFKA